MKAFFDIDTQLDFMVPGGALYGPGAEKLIPRVALLNRFASDGGVPLISTTDAHPEDAAEFRVWPPHCVVGTFGQQKPVATLLSGHSVVTNDTSFDLSSLDPAAKQIILEKNDLDLFSNPHTRALLDKLNVTECAVYGVFVDYCVKCAIFGLLKAGRRVSLVIDAADHISPDAGKQVISDFVAAGGRLVNTSEVVN
jgi:nicotinamidase/pyrazinamidase